jgi:type I restriction enzyme S subunit
MNKNIPINKVIDSISITHKFNKPILKFLNTSDVHNGKITNINLLPKSKLKGQAKKTIMKGDILFSEIRPKNRRFAYIDFDDTEDFVVSTKLMVLRNNNPEVNNKYFYYFLTSQQMLQKLQSRAENRIGSFPQITFDVISDYTINLPDLEIQKKIANLLDLLNEKIELNNKMNLELENLAKTIYDYWFVQFDFPDENGKPYKSSGGKMVWNDDLQKEIPEGWLVQNIKENNISKLIKPGINNFDNFKTYLATADVDNNRINFNADKVTLNNRESRANMQPIKDSIWFAKMKNSKKVMYFGNYSDYFVNNFILSTGFAGLKVNNSVYLEYLWCFINNDNFEKIKDLLSNGATQKAINNENMQYIPLLIPNFEIIKKFHEVTKDIYHKIYIINIENNELTELRDWLLPMLMNGQVTLND